MRKQYALMVFASLMFVGGATKSMAQSATEQLENKKIVSVAINGIEREQQLDNAYVFLSLDDLIGEVITQPDYINYLIEKGTSEIANSQQPFGYYQVSVASQREVVDDELSVMYAVTLGEPTVLKEVEVRLEGEANTDAAYLALVEAVPLKVGEVLNHQAYEQYKNEFVSLASSKGYFSSQFKQSVIYVEPDALKADVKLNFDSGARYVYRSVNFDDVPLDDDLLARFVFFNKGEPYDAADLSKLQQDLQGSGYFKQAFVGGEPDTASGGVDVSAQLTMNKTKRYALGLGYSTDTGVRAKFNFDHRRINRRGHTFSSRLYISQKESHWDNIYRIPAKYPASDYYFFRFGGELKERSFDQKSAYAEGGYQYRIGKWEHRYGLNLLYERFKLGVDADEVLLIYPKGRWVYTSTENRLDPTTGLQVRFELMGASRSLLSDVSFVQSNMDLRFIETLGDKHRFIAKAGLGATWTDDFHRLPASLRYFAGGDKSVRGYAYQSLGARDVNNDNIGGRYLSTASLEYEYYFKPNWAAAVFVDAGDAFMKNYKPVFGAGLGLHWRSPVGPIKIDIGHGFDKQYGDSYRLHINIGGELDL